jgi:hypothetical protein
MYMSPTLSGQLARERQREMLAQADRLRLAREVRHAAPMARAAESGRRRAGRLFRRPRPVTGPC